MRIRSIRDVAASVRGRRQELGLSQAELARRAGVSRKWVYEFEAGKPAAELGLVLRVLEPLGLTLEVTRLPDDAADGELDRLLGRLADRRE
jgi:HTH-type transcriptional regulator/antitoxin HipB